MLERQRIGICTLYVHPTRADATEAEPGLRS